MPTPIICAPTFPTPCGQRKLYLKNQPQSRYIFGMSTTFPSIQSASSSKAQDRSTEVVRELKLSWVHGTPSFMPGADRRE